MSTGRYEAVIVGGGMSGLTAAIALARRGRKVALISKGDPVCCLSTGCIDVLGGTAKPLEGIKQLPKEHPYQLVGQKGIRDSLDFFTDVMQTARYPYHGDAKTNQDIMTPIGTRKTTCLVPDTMKNARMGADEYLHVISFKKIKDFFPSYIMAQHKNAGYSVFDAGVATTLGIATKFEDPAFRKDFIAWLKSTEIPDGKIALPAVLGIGSTLDIITQIRNELDREIFEIPTIPPSIPGLRLFKTLKNYLQSLGGDVYWGKGIASVEKSGGVIEAVTLSRSGRPTRVEGSVYVLATGSFVSGGLYAQQREGVEETVFGLPAFIPEGRENWFNQDFFERGHAVEKAGIRVDKDFRPEEADYQNLFVCGSILAFSEIMKYQCGHGLAIATGHAVANKCEEQLS